MIAIIACHINQAEIVARAKELRPRHWRYVREVSDLYGITVDSIVVAMPDDLTEYTDRRHDINMLLGMIEKRDGKKAEQVWT